MSFREVRETTEILRALGYPRLVSMENFRFPNFTLMAEILEWTVRKFEPNARFPKQMDSEQERVIFVKSAVLTLLQKAHVRLNPKNIYQSDGHAIRELLPVLKMLYESVKQARKRKQKADGAEETIQIGELRAQVNAKRQEVRQSFQLAAEVPKSGANLYELLRDEILAKEVRSKALGHALNGAQIEKEIRERIQTTETKIAEHRQRLENIGNDEQELGKKIERRRRELEQLQKRLAKLQSFRPPYMDEYERYELELKEHYAMYVVLFRNLHYLQQQLAQAERTAQEQAVDAEQSMRVAVEKMRMESEQQQSAQTIAGIQMMGDNEGEQDQKQTKDIRVFGNMTGAGLSDDEDEEEEEDGPGRIIEMEDEEEEEEDEEDEHLVKQRQLLMEREEEEENFGHNAEEEDGEEHSENDF